jgi:hypothetical protein
MRFYGRAAIRRNTMTFDEFLRQQQAKEASPEYQARRTTYLQGRNAELDRIAKFDADYRERLERQPDPDAYAGDLHFEERRIRDDEALELGLCSQVLVNAVETFLLTLPEPVGVPGEQYIRKATTTRELIVSLRKEDEEMNRMFVPWDPGEISSAEFPE